MGTLQWPGWFVTLPVFLGSAAYDEAFVAPVTGESAVRKYASFGEGGPWRVAVDDLAKAGAALCGSVETVPAFADIELCETRDPAAYFQVVTDETGKRWASRIQCWLELQAGDARQQQAAAEVRAQILKGAGA